MEFQEIVAAIVDSVVVTTNLARIDACRAMGCRLHLSQRRKIDGQRTELVLLGHAGRCAHVDVVRQWHTLSASGRPVVCA